MVRRPTWVFFEFQEADDSTMSNHESTSTRDAVGRSDSKSEKYPTTGVIQTLGMDVVHEHSEGSLRVQIPRLADYVARREQAPLSLHPAWPLVLAEGLGHIPYCLETQRGGQTTGLLPLCSVNGPIFGRFLVGLPYLNYGGVLADSKEAERLLIDRAVELAERIDARYLELRHAGSGVDHAALTHRVDHKLHMKLSLPKTVEALWDELPAKVRNQVRKAQKGDLTLIWGGEDLLAEFHAVFSKNMRDLGTPSYGVGLFRAILRNFPDRAELCVVRSSGRPAAAAMLLHGLGITEVPSASSLKELNYTNANMLMYWNLLMRATQRGQSAFDFGRSSRDSGTYRFKAQWGAEPRPSAWQYRLRRGGLKDARPDNPRYRRMIRLWQRLPLSLTRLIGPLIVRGIP